MHKIIVPKLSNNDDSCTLKTWLKADGDAVQAGDIVAVVEDSKAAYDIEAERAGRLQQVARVDAECAHGSTIGYLLESDEAAVPAASGAKLDAGAGLEGVIVTKAAQQLIDAHGISTASVAALGLKVVQRADVEALTQRKAAEPSAKGRPSRRQSTIAAVVTRSHTTIPRAFLAVKVTCNRAIEALRLRGARDGAALGLPELMIKLLAKIAPKFPDFYGRVTDDGQLIPTQEPTIGVTLDLGRGLFVPTIRGASGLTMGEIASVLMEYRIKAMRNAFRAEDLRNSDISLALSHETGVVFSIPFILPEQPCMVSLGSVLDEAALGPDGALFERRYTNLGLAYDHRVMNGAAATEFLHALRTHLESGEIP